METQGMRQQGSTSQSGDANMKFSDAIEPSPSTEYEPLHLKTLEPSSSLIDQCNCCNSDIRRCIIQARQAVLNTESPARSKFEPIEKRLLEHTLRLDIWRTDCGVAEGYLEIIGSLTQCVSDILMRFHKHLEAIAETINSFREHVPKKFAENNWDR
jgi:hypothetical protein